MPSSSAGDGEPSSPVLTAIDELLGQLAAEDGRERYERESLHERRQTRMGRASNERLESRARADDCGKGVGHAGNRTHSGENEEARVSAGSFVR